jgi:alkyl hydroperoxide reductase subunit AhpC
LDEKHTLLRVGMRAKCRFHIALPPEAVAIPTWLLPNLRRPRVVMHDGTVRDVRGYAVGHHFVVTGGLRAEERIRVDSVRPDDATIRVTGVVEPCDTFPVELPSRRHWHYEIVDIVPDGSYVHRDQVVAKLQQRRRSTDRYVARLEAGEVEARSQFAIDRINAETQLIRAYISWRKAKLDEERAKLDHLIARYVSYTPDITKTEVRLANAETDLRNLEEETRIRTEPYFRETMSVNQVKDLELRLALSRIGYRKAQVKRIAEFRKRNCAVIGVSIDSHFTHLAWKNTPVQAGGIGNVQFPLVSDLDKSISRQFGVLHDDAVALRGLFLIDRDSVIRHALINDLPLGRNVDEAIRVLDALQFHEQHGEVCPANWKPGEDAMQPTAEGVAAYLASHPVN